MTTAETGTRDWGDTVRIKAEVQATGGRSFSGFLHLLPFASIHLGPETPEDVLNRDEAFFALTDEREHTIFIAKAQVLAVAIEHPLRDPDRLHAARAIGLKVELSDGSEHTGTVLSEAGSATKFPPTDLLLWGGPPVMFGLIYLLLGARNRTVGEWLRRRKK